MGKQVGTENESQNRRRMAASFDLLRLPPELVLTICQAVVPDHLEPPWRIYTHYYEAREALATLESLSRTNRFLRQETSRSLRRCRDAVKAASNDKYNFLPYVRTILRDSEVACQETRLCAGHFNRLGEFGIDDADMLDEASDSDLPWRNIRTGSTPSLQGINRILDRDYDGDRQSPWTSKIYEIILPRMSNLRSLSVHNYITFANLAEGAIPSLRHISLEARIRRRPPTDPIAVVYMVDVAGCQVLFRAAPNLESLQVTDCCHWSEPVDLANLTSLTFRESLLGRVDVANMILSCPRLERFVYETIKHEKQHSKMMNGLGEPEPPRPLRELMRTNPLQGLRSLPSLREMRLGQEVLLWFTQSGPPGVDTDCLVRLIPPSLQIFHLDNLGPECTPAATRFVDQIERGCLANLIEISFKPQRRVDRFSISRNRHTCLLSGRASTYGIDEMVMHLRFRLQILSSTHPGMHLVSLNDDGLIAAATL